MIDTFDQELSSHMDELTDILGSNLDNKEKHVQRLASYHEKHKSEILDSFESWKELQMIEVPELRPEMDVAFYKMLNEQSDVKTLMSDSKVAEKRENIISLSTVKKLAVAATFIMGMAIGNWMDFGSGGVATNEIAIVENENASDVRFASLEETPFATDRIKGINEVRDQNNPNLTIIEALNKVILRDPNVNVRLTAIETMVLFSDMPEARTYLIEAIPYQESSIVQLELADVMISLEESRSAEKWKELLQSDLLENDAKVHLEESLRTIL